MNLWIISMLDALAFIAMISTSFVYVILTRAAVWAAPRLAINPSPLRATNADACPCASQFSPGRLCLLYYDRIVSISRFAHS